MNRNHEEKQNSDRIQFPEAWAGWEVIERIGTGSFGTVYLAEKDGAEQAVKVITIPADESERAALLIESRNEQTAQLYLKDLVESYANEIHTMYSLQENAHIVRIEDHLIEESDPFGYRIYIRMELLTSLRDHFAGRRVSEAEAVQVGLDICDALIACDTKRIIHRDIKPDNIFVSDDGSFKLGDFGTARQLDMTFGTYSAKGTYSYMAPEVYKQERYNKQVDLYSLGMVLFRMMNRNREPFVDPEKQLIYYQDREEAIRRRMEGEPLPDPLDASEKFSSVIRKACAYRAEKRYPNAAAMKADLLKVLDPNAVIPEYVESAVKKTGDNNALSTSGSFKRWIALLLFVLVTGTAVVIGFRQNHFLNQNSAEQTNTLQSEPNRQTEPDGLVQQEEQTEPDRQEQQDMQTEPDRQAQQEEHTEQDRHEQTEEPLEKLSEQELAQMSPLEMISAMGLTYIGNTQYAVRYTTSDGLVTADRSIPTGVISYEQADFDGDGDTELLLFLLKPMDNQGQSVKLSIILLENEGGRWVWKDSSDIPNIETSLKELSPITELLPDILFYLVEEEEELRVLICCDSLVVEDSSSFYGNLLSIFEVRCQDNRLVLDLYNYKSGSGIREKLSALQEAIQDGKATPLGRISVPEVFTEDGPLNGAKVLEPEIFPMDATLLYADYSRHGEDSSVDSDQAALSLYQDFYQRYRKEYGIQDLGEGLQTEGTLPFDSPVLLTASLYQPEEGETPELILIRTELSESKTEIGMPKQECHLLVEDYYIQNGTVTLRGQLRLANDLCWNGPELKIAGRLLEQEGASWISVHIRYRGEEDKDYYYFIRPGREFALEDSYQQWGSIIESSDAFAGSYNEWVQELEQKYGLETPSDLETAGKALFSGTKTGSQITTDYTEVPDYQLTLQCLNELTGTE